MPLADAGGLFEVQAEGGAAGPFTPPPEFMAASTPDEAALCSGHIAFVHLTGVGAKPGGADYRLVLNGVLDALATGTAHEDPVQFRHSDGTTVFFVHSMKEAVVLQGTLSLLHALASHAPFLLHQPHACQARAPGLAV